MVVAKISAAAFVAAFVCLTGGAVRAEAAVFAAAQNTPPQAQKSAPSAQAVSQRDQTLIESVEKAYQAGLSNYRDGHTVAARSNFDYAVDLILRSGIDIKNDPAISEEFDHIVDAINTLDIDALREGGAQQAQAHPEDAPVDIANDVTFTADPKVRAQAEAELKTTQSDLPLVINDYVASFINFYTNTTKGHNPLQRHDHARAQGRRCSAGSLLSRRRGIRLPSAGRQSRLGSRRHVAVHALRSLWTGAQRLV
jgi:membrane-bound lytic murein transglycosylase D